MFSVEDYGCIEVWVCEFVFFCSVVGFMCCELLELIIGFWKEIQNEGQF